MEEKPQQKIDYGQPIDIENAENQDQDVTGGAMEDTMNQFMATTNAPVQMDDSSLLPIKPGGEGVQQSLTMTMVSGQ